jgi:6-phosphogluconolactonase (cycloisomerase 2 family)
VALVLGLSGGVAYAVFGSLTFVEFEKDGVAGVDGLNGASEPVVSPDGAHVYVATQIPDSAVATFSRNASTGALAFVEVDKDGVGGVDGLEDARELAISPDGASVYAVSGATDDGVAAFSRNASSGALTFVEAEEDGVGVVDGLAQASDVAVSPDGDHVYVTGEDDDAVATFSRNPSTGALTFVEQQKDGVNGVDGLDGASGVAISPGGAHVYVGSETDDAVATFSRNPSTGALTFVEQQKDGVNGVDGLDGASAVAAAPGGAHVYAVSNVDNAVVTFSRNPSTGALTFVEQDKDGVGGVDGLLGASAVAPSPDGAHVYTAALSDNAIATFSRNRATGALTFVEQDKDGVGGVDGLQGARGVGASPDGAHVYVTGFSDDAVVAFARQGPPPPPDGGPGPGPPALTLDLGAKKQKLKKKLKFFATASADSTLVARGKGIRKKTSELAANEETKVKAKLKRAKYGRLANKLEENGKAKVKVEGTATDQSGAATTDEIKVKLKD